MNANEDNEFEFAVEYTTNLDYLSGAFYAISSMSELDPMSKDGIALKNKIMRRSMRIIDACIAEMYSELFDSEEE